MFFGFTTAPTFAQPRSPKSLPSWTASGLGTTKIYSSYPGN